MRIPVVVEEEDDATFFARWGAQVRAALADVWPEAKAETQLLSDHELGYIYHDMQHFARSTDEIRLQKTAEAFMRELERWNTAEAKALRKHIGKVICTMFSPGLSNDATARRIAVLVKEAWERAGVKVDLGKHDGGRLTKAVTKLLGLLDLNMSTAAASKALRNRRN
jgi:predicted phosphohydrolase